ncbi:MAG: hypothetical protein HY858_01565 [Candidatus Solibacter usitatus]|nr:hypothetical protein [Candidatus Solibacter usitatus]
MRRTLTFLAVVAVAMVAESATVVLRGGKQITVASYEQKGNLVILTYENGRVEGYPLAAVDLAKTRVANQQVEPDTAPTPSVPHSPFLAARSVTGSSAVLVTDADVRHTEEPEATEKKPDEVADALDSAQISLVTYDRKKVSEGEWEVTATFVNQGKAPATGISAVVRLLAVDGKPLGTGTGTFEGQLAANQQGAMRVKVAAPGDVGQVGFEFQWVSIQPVQPSPVPSPSLTTPPVATAPPPRGQAPAGYGVLPAGSSPNTVPGNPLGLAPTNQLGSPPQVQPPTPAPASPPPQ